MCVCVFVCLFVCVPVSYVCVKPNRLTAKCEGLVFPRDTYENTPCKQRLSQVVFCVFCADCCMFHSCVCVCEAERESVCACVCMRVVM